jgi:O-antigen/teichoic acid export membrane protein
LEDTSHSNISSQNNKRIAKNTLMLYLRMGISMLVSLYTSRVVLNTLGVNDFGIYNVIGGVVALFGFITSSMSSATSRFLTYDLGLNDLNNLKKTFSAAITVHLLIAIIILILTETLGLWFLENKLVIDPIRMYAARIVYQFSILNSIIYILLSPYIASVLSHERMNIYALFEIIIVFLKLFTVILLTYAPFDKLITYASLLLILSFIHFGMYVIYCRRDFVECRFKISTDKSKIKPMLSFSGWDLYGNMSVVARTQGVNMLLNMFFGTLLNAASGISTQIQGALSSFASNILTAVKPQVVKSYAIGNYTYTAYLLNNTAKFSSLLLLVIFIPVIIEMPFILKIWLINVPEYTVEFSRLTLLFAFIANISSVIMSGIHATGKIKRSSVWNGTIYLSVIPIAYIAFKWNSSPVFPFILNAIFVVIGASLNMWYLSKYMKEFSLFAFLRKSIMPVLIIGATSFALCIFAKPYIKNDWLRLLFIFIINTYTICQLSYCILLNSSERLMIKNYVNKWKIKKN